jgi:hypothetical protein
VNIPGIFKKSYIKINLIFGVLIILVFVYSLSFSSSKQNYPLPSFYYKISGNNSISTGLSRSFSELIRGNLKKSIEYNKYGPRIFIFFLAQFFLRIIFSYLYSVNFINNNYTLLSDSIISVSLFIICFWPFILDLVLAIHY